MRLRTGEEAAIVRPEREFGEGMESRMPLHAGDDHVLVKVGLHGLAAVEARVQENRVTLELELAASIRKEIISATFWVCALGQGRPY